MPQTQILVPYEEFSKLKSDAEAKKAALDLLGVEFADPEDKIIAIKAVLGYVEPEEPEDPETDPEVDPEDPTP